MKRLIIIIGALIASNVQATAENMTVYGLIETMVHSESKVSLMAVLPDYGFTVSRQETGPMMFSSADVGGNITFIDEPPAAYAIFVQPDASTAKERAEDIVAKLMPEAVQTAREATGESWALGTTEPTTQVFWEVQGNVSLPVLGILKSYNRN